MKREGDGMLNWLIAIAMGGLLFWMWLRQDQERMRSAREQAEQALRRAEKATKETGDRLKSAIEEGRERAEDFVEASRERAEDLVEVGRERASELKTQAEEARAEVQRRAAEFRQDVQEQAERVVDVTKDRVNTVRTAVEDRVEDVVDTVRETDSTPRVEERVEVEPDFVETAVAKTEERAEELREKLEDTMRETRLAAPSTDEGLPVLNVDTSIAPPVEEVVSRAHTLADQLREQAAANAAPARDDLARIEGIGERSAQALYKAGILTFAQLAALSDEEIRQKLEDGGVHPHNTLNSWREQATRFAQEQSGEQTQSDQSEAL